VFWPVAFPNQRDCHRHRSEQRWSFILHKAGRQAQATGESKGVFFMSKEVIASIIKSFSGQANVLAIPKIYIQLLDGDIEAALFLSQCVYWSDKTKNKNGFYKSVTEWQEETGLTRYRIGRCAAVCDKWIATSVHRANGAPTTHYLLDLPSLCQSVTDLLESDKSDLQVSKPDLQETYKSDLQETSKCLTETTQEITNTITAAKEPAAKSDFQLQQQALINRFCQLTGIPEPDHKSKSFGPLWGGPSATIIKALNGSSLECLPLAINRLKQGRCTIATLKSIVNTIMAVYGEQQQIEPDKDAIMREFLKGTVTPDEAYRLADIAHGRA
jgi:hypothetical protein